MSRFLSWVQGFAVALGGPGLFAIAFLDSSFLSFPEITDVLIIVLVAKHPERFLWYTALPTIGSIAGCYVLYALARRGGEAFLRKRLRERHVERALSVFRKYGLLAVAIPSILPPPVPFKIFVSSVCSAAPGGPATSRMSYQVNDMNTVFHFSTAFLFMTTAPGPWVAPLK